MNQIGIIDSKPDRFTLETKKKKKKEELHRHTVKTEEVNKEQRSMFKIEDDAAAAVALTYSVEQVMARFVD